MGWWEKPRKDGCTPRAAQAATSYIRPRESPAVVPLPQPPEQKGTRPRARVRPPIRPPWPVPAPAPSRGKIHRRSDPAPPQAPVCLTLSSALFGLPSTLAPNHFSGPPPQACRHRPHPLVYTAAHILVVAPLPRRHPREHTEYSFLRRVRTPSSLPDTPPNTDLASRSGRFYHFPRSFFVPLALTT